MQNIKKIQSASIPKNVNQFVNTAPVNQQGKQKSSSVPPPLRSKPKGDFGDEDAEEAYKLLREYKPEPKNPMNLSSQMGMNQTDKKVDETLSNRRAKLGMESKNISNVVLEAGLKPQLTQEIEVQ